MNQPTMSTTIDVANLKVSPNAVVINETNLSQGIIMRERALLNNSNMCHKINVYNCGDLHRDVVLKSIMDDAVPYDFIPVLYMVEGTTASFFIKNCRLAIEKLCRQNLIISNTQIKGKPLKLTIILGFTSTDKLVVDVESNLAQVIAKRYNSVTKTLNLDNFSKDPDLIEYCPLSQTKILYFVLHLCKQNPLHQVRLVNNDIRFLSPLESIWSKKTLTSLDLRSNLITNMQELNVLKTMHITELLLDGNPVCDDYDEYSYVQKIKEVCPKIEKLDGLPLGQKGFLAFRRNFLCNIEGQDLVDQFIEHYFLLYDSPNRKLLEGLYTKDSLFSLTSQYLLGQTSSATANLSEYKRISRNLNLISDLSKSNEFLIQGASNIIRVLCNLPSTEHDPYTFTVDLVYYTSKNAIITVTGVLREVARSLLDAERILGFSRTFVLVNSGSGEYNIINEQLHVSNATTIQQQIAFKIVKVPKPNHLTVEPARNAKDKSNMEKAFKQITSLNLDWSKKCLEECSYDLKRALTLFVDWYKVDKIPEHAFE